MKNILTLVLAVTLINACSKKEAGVSPVPEASPSPAPEGGDGKGTGLDSDKGTKSGDGSATPPGSSGSGDSGNTTAPKAPDALLPTPTPEPVVTPSPSEPEGYAFPGGTWEKTENLGGKIINETVTIDANKARIVVTVNSAIQADETFELKAETNVIPPRVTLSAGDRVTKCVYSIRFETTPRRLNLNCGAPGTDFPRTLFRARIFSNKEMQAHPIESWLKPSEAYTSKDASRCQYTIRVKPDLTLEVVPGHVGSNYCNEKPSSYKCLPNKTFCHDASGSGKILSVCRDGNFFLDGVEFWLQSKPRPGLCSTKL